MMVSFRSKKEELQEALQSEDYPYQVARVFDVPPIATKKAPSEPKKLNNAETFQDGGLDWTPVLTAWCDAANAAIAGYAIKCYEAQSTLHANFHQVFSASMGNWLVPTLHAICRNTHRVAIAADKEASSSDGRGKEAHANLQKGVALLQESYSKSSNDRKEFRPDAPLDEEGSKKAGVLAIVNELFAIYFRLNTLRLCKNLLRPVESRKLHEQGNMGQMVTYRYYVGRLFLFEDQYQAAEQNLDYALQHCHPSSVHNKRCILRYLVPVKLYRGRLPSAKLLERYSLHEFIPIVEGVRRGDLRTFHDGLVKHQDLFIHRGTYLLLEKCKTVCYRNLFKRIHVIEDKHQLSLKDVAQALKWLGMPIDLDEVECILANLIFRGYIRGYLSHAKRVLVLSKRDPFPVAAVITK